MINQPFSGVRSDRKCIIEAVCINCNKRFNSTRAVGMHLKATAARHAVSFINHGNYDKKTEFREMNPLEFASTLDMSDK